MTFAAHQYTLRHIASTDALRAIADDWNDLWLRSDKSLPSSRAEIVAQWLDHFAPTAPVMCLAVEHDSHLVAALPLYGTRKAKLLPIASLPGNDWSPAGDLLLDPEVGPDALDALFKGLGALKWPLIIFDEVALDSPPWRQALAALDRVGLPYHQEQRCEIDRVTLSGDFSQYLASRTRNHRRHMQVCLQRARAAGGVHLNLIEQAPVDQVAHLLERGFAVEDRSWKGANGSSVLRSPGVFEYFCRQAELLADKGHLLLAFLELGSQPIAFEYGWWSKGTYYTPKVGYDVEHERLSPGQLLRRMLLEEFFGDPRREEIDFLGPQSAATGRWATSSYSMSRLTIATRRPLGRWLMGVLQRLRPAHPKGPSAQHITIEEEACASA